MPEKTCNFELRRTLLKGALATGVLVTLRANAAELPPVNANDPAAKALRYVDDATSLPAGARKEDSRVHDLSLLYRCQGRPWALYAVSGQICGRRRLVPGLGGAALTCRSGRGLQ